MSATSPSVAHVVKGVTVLGADTSHGDFSCPALDLDTLVWLREGPGPAFDLPVAEIIDFLVEVGAALDFDKSPLLQEALEMLLPLSSLDRRILENTYRAAGAFLQRSALELQVECDPGTAVLDGWVPQRRVGGRSARVRAFPPRLAHITAGNTPAVALTTIVRGALSKGVHLIKMPANDLFTATAILRTMAAVDPDHPTTRSFSAVYWRGGDTRVESAILRSQFYDKLVVWGGGPAVEGALRYAAPGFEIVSFDPKVSVSMVGREVFDSSDGVQDAAARAATDISLYNQDACAASRFLFIEGSSDEVDGFCAVLADELKVDRFLSSELASPLPPETQDEVDVLRGLDPLYRVWGDYSGTGLVIRSDEPVDLYPVSKTVNVVTVNDLGDAVRHTNVATQTVGVYPLERAADLRDVLASRGVQRIVALGHVASPVEGLPHDGFYPISRVMRWIADECEHDSAPSAQSQAVSPRYLVRRRP